MSHIDRLQRYNPELQKRSLENRKGRQQDFDSFVNKLKEYSKSDKPSMHGFPRVLLFINEALVWEAAAADEATQRANALDEQTRQAAEIQKRRDEIRRHSISGQ